MLIKIQIKIYTKKNRIKLRKNYRMKLVSKSRRDRLSFRKIKKD